MRTVNSRLVLKLGIVAAMAALAGCNSMSAQECLLPIGGRSATKTA